MIREIDCYQDEIEFLEKYGLEELDFIDARGMTCRQYKPIAKAKYCHFVLGNESRCGHRLKTRNGHCIQCYPERISMQMGGDSICYTYAAQAIDTRLYKVGSTSDPERRISQLNDASYGGSSHWLLVKTFKLTLARELEHAWHRQLSSYRRKGTQRKDGEFRWATELFKCSKEQLFEGFNRACDELLSEL